MTRPTLSRAAFLRGLVRLGACDEALWWCRTMPGTPAQLWRKCPDARWMFWLLGALDYDRKAIVLAACDCARLALVHVPAGETRPLQCLETTEAWARGGATIEQARAARQLAWQAWADADAAYADADAAYADAAAAYAAAAAAAAAAASADDASAASAASRAEPYPTDPLSRRHRAAILSARSALDAAKKGTP